MGIERDIVNTTFRLQWAATAWVEREEASVSKWRVMVDDYLIRYQALFNGGPKEGEEKKTRFTHAELFDKFFWPVRRALFGSGAKFQSYVMVCDDRSNVPKFKQAEQQRRVAAIKKAEAKKEVAAAEPYAEGWDIGSAGITFSEPEGSDKELEEHLIPDLADMVLACLSSSGNKDEAEIDLRRLKVSDPTGKRLYESFLPLIAEEMKERAPIGTTFYFDFDKAGPILFDSEGAYTLQADLAHNLGEADPALMWWVDNHPPLLTSGDEPIDYHVQTTDTDFSAIYLLNHDDRQRPQDNVFWQRSPDQFVDMRILADRVVHNSKTTLRVVGAWMILCGCDFLPRESYAFRLIHVVPKILTAVIAALGEYSSGGGAGGMREIFELFVRKLHHTETKSKHGVQVPPRFRKPETLATLARLREWYPYTAADAFLGTKHRTIPTDEAITELAVRFEFTYVYWSCATIAFRPDQCMAR